MKDVSPWTKIVELTLPQNLSAASNLREVESGISFLDDLFKKPFIGHNQVGSLIHYSEKLSTC